MCLKNKISSLESTNQDNVDEIDTTLNKDDILVVNKTEEQSFCENCDDFERETGNTRYDRQIRLFGFRVQNHIAKIRVQVIGIGNAIVAEIIKNLVLLGVNKIVIEEGALKDFYKLVPNKITEINKNLEVIYSNNVIQADFLFIMDRIINSPTDFYFVCSKCYLIKKNNCVHNCVENNARDIVLDCLIGAIVVQEFLKIIEKKSHLEEYKLEL